MPDVFQPAPSGRAKCRGCGRAIAAGELRFGESLPTPYREGESLFWFHLPCAACRRPEKVLPVLAGATGVPDAAWLQATAEAGIQWPRLTRLARAERSPSGRARCRCCQETIDKGQFRLALQIFEDGRFSPIGSIHVPCAQVYFGTSDILDRLARLQVLDTGDAAAIAELLKQPRAAAQEDASSERSSAPGLAKTRADAPANPSDAEDTQRAPALSRR